MARAYSMDPRELRSRPPEVGDLTREKGAERFDISEATLYAWLRRQHEAGNGGALSSGRPSAADSGRRGHAAAPQDRERAE